MSTDHESHSFYAEDEEELKRAARLDKVYLMTTAVGIGMCTGIFTDLVLDATVHTLKVSGVGTIAGTILGALTGIILLFVNRRKTDVEWSVTAQDSDAEPPESA